jgi:hypothetical protein
MSYPTTLPPSPAGFEIRFESLYQAGKCLAFPCDEKGHVEMDTLSERARMNYLYARALMGREFAAPAVYARAH